MNGLQGKLRVSARLENKGLTVPQVKRRRLPTQYTKFGSVSVSRDGRVRFSAWTVPGHPSLDFLADHWTIPEPGRDVYNSANYTIVANVRGQPVFFLHLTRRRVESAGFAYNLTPDGLREAVHLLRHAGSGLEEWIIPGLAHMQAALAEQKSDPNREALKALIPELLESVRDLPIAKPWEPLRKQWEQWKRRQAKQAPRAAPKRRPSKARKRS